MGGRGREGEEGPKKEHETATEWLYRSCFQILEQRCEKIERRMTF